MVANFTGKKNKIINKLLVTAMAATSNLKPCHSIVANELKVGMSNSFKLNKTKNILQSV